MIEKYLSNLTEMAKGEIFSLVAKAQMPPPFKEAALERALFEDNACLRTESQHVCIKQGRTAADEIADLEALAAAEGGNIKAYFLIGGVMQQKPGLALIFDRKAAQIFLARGQRSIDSPCNGGVRMAYCQKAAIVIIEAAVILKLLRNGGAYLLFVGIGGAGRISDKVIIAPEHCKAAVGIGAFAAAGAAHAISSP